MTGTTGPLPSLLETDQGNYAASQASGPGGGVAATLSQVSRDVNRILTQLGSLRITPGETIDENHPVMEEIHPRPNDSGPASHGVEDEAEPPDYDDQQGSLPSGQHH